MKKILFAASILGLFIPAISTGAISILQGYQGGTGISTTTAGNVGYVLSISSVNPLTYTFIPAASGGTATTTINGVMGPVFLFSATSTGSTVGYSTSTGSVVLNIPKNISFFTNDAGYATSSSAATWGGITGTLSSQTDLQNALNAKLSTTTASTTYVPYTGASANVLLGVNKLQTPVIFPASDSTTALQFNKADGTTNVLNIDTTNGRVGIGTTAPLSKLGVTGSASIGATYGAIAAPTSGMIIEGNVGIGTMSPTYRIGQGHLTDYPTRTSIITSTDIPELVLGTTEATNRYSDLIFGAQNSAGFQVAYAGLTAQMTTNTTGGEEGYLSFLTKNNTNYFAERMRIDKSGNVGIGTTSPGAKLDIQSASGILEGRVWQTSGNAIAKLSVGSGDWWNLVSNPTSGTNAYGFEIQKAGSAKLVIDTNGNVGIGTTAPKAKLSVNGSLATKLREVSSATTTTITDSIIGVISTSSPITITLADATTLDSGQEITIKDEGGNAVASNITIATTASQKIDGASTFTIGTNYGSVTLYGNGSNYYVK